MLKIGNVNIGTNVFLAPLSGCTDLPFRLIAREHGARFCFYEMIDANSLKHNHRRSFDMLKTTAEDSPIAGQLLGSDPSMMLEAAQKILDRAGISFLDINCACPAKKVLKKKAGAYLLREAPQMYRMLKALTSSLGLPVTVKIRIGFDRKDDRHIVAVAKNCEDLGVAAIFVHGRLAKQGYAGEVDYGAIKRIKESVKIPVLGSGNVFSPELAKKMLDETGCDGVLVARGALGNPWIFRQIDEYLKTGGLSAAVKAEERHRELKRHLDYIEKYRVMTKAGKVGFMRGVVMWYLKGMPHAARLREKIMRAKSHEELVKVSSED